MSALFSKPKTPKVPQPEPVPTRDDAILASQEKDKMDNRRGKASTILAQNKSRTATNAKDVLGGY